MLSNHIWIQYLWLERPLVMTAVRKKVNRPDNVEDQLGLSHWNFSGRNDKRLRQKSQHLFRGVCCRRSQQAKGRWMSYILKISAVFLATWTEHVFVTVLCHFLHTHTRFTTMGHGWVGAEARTSLSSSATSYATFAPVSPWRPATIHWKESNDISRDFA